MRELRRELANGNGNGKGRGVGPVTSDDGVMVLGAEELKELTLRKNISRIVVADAELEVHPNLLQTLFECKLRGLGVEHYLDYYEHLHRKVWLKGFRPRWLVCSRDFTVSKAFLFLKHIFDVAFALAVILLTAPLLALISIAIKLTSPGPVFLRQERIGQQGKPFTLLKFRSMRENAELETGPVWAQKNDRRVTSIGRFLRRFHLDELPQAFNVLRGDLTFVGPRPERPYFVEVLKQRIPYYSLRHCVQPGVTGWAQVNYGYGASIEDAYEKLQYDLYYIKNMSLTLEVKILLKTLGRVFWGQGQ